MEAELVTYLEDHTGLNGLVAERIYPLRLPKNYTVPAIVFQRVGTSRTVCYDGPSQIANARFQFDIWARTYAEVKEIVAQLVTALLGFVGTMGETRVWVTDEPMELDGYEPDTKLYRGTVDFGIKHD